MLFKASLLPVLVAPIAATAFMPAHPHGDISRRSEASAYHHGLDTFKKLTPSKSIIWKPCLNRFQCAMLDVPLDYHDKTAGAPRAYVPLIKYAATDTKNYKGMILVNPGGPGGSGVQMVMGMFELLANATETVGIIGPNYDIIGFEPRGVGLSIPSANCTNNTSPSAGIGKRFDLPNGPILNFALSNGNEMEQMQKAAALQCQKTIGGPNGAGQHMSTATVARDMVSITDAFAATADGAKVKNSTLTNYLGYSYGTILGQTFASMFPERVGRFLLSGVVDPDDHISGLPMRSLQSADENFATFFVYCSLAGSEKCPYAIGDTPGDIFLRFERSLARLDIDKALEKGWANATIISTALKGVKANIMLALYDPRVRFSGVAEILVVLEPLLARGNVTVEDLAKLSPGGDKQQKTEPGSPDEWLVGVTCADQKNIMSNVTAKEIWPLVSAVQHTSYIGADSILQNLFACLGWSIFPKEAYQGPFGGKTANPILFVGNNWDPITPIYNAFKGANIFTRAEVLTVNEPGHAITNYCAVKKMRAYLQDGTMPGNNHFCIGTEPGKGVFDTTLTMRMEENGAWREIVQRMRGLRLKSWKALP